MTRRKLLRLILVCLQLTISTSASSTITIGGVFGYNLTEMVFKKAIEYVNNHTDLLPNHKLECIIHTHFSQPLEAYQYIQSVYNLLELGVSTVVGPGFSSVVRATHYMSEATHVPQITYAATDSYLLTEPGNNYQYLLKMSPPDVVQMKALVSIVEHFKWTQVAILASNTDFGRNAVQVFTTLAIKKSIIVLAEETFAPLENTTNVNVIPQLYSIKQKAATVVILVSESLFRPTILQQAQETGMLHKTYQWILYDAELTLDPKLNYDKLYGILGLQSASTEGSLGSYYTQVMGNSSAELFEPYISRTFDSVLALAYALDKYTKDGHELTPYAFSRMNKTTSAWKDGKMLMQYLGQVSGKGVTNEISFRSSLTPKFAKFNVVNLQKTGWTTLGTWKEDSGLNINNNSEAIFLGRSKTSPVDMSYDLTGVHFRVASVIFPPFTVKKKYGNGTEYFDGYSVELLHKLQEELKFRSTIYLVADSRFGTQDPVTKEWNGMVGDVLNMQADIALSALTVTKERLQYLQFSTPYMSAPLGILMKKPTEDSTLTTFLAPFTTDLWFTVIALLVAFSFVLSIVASFSPYDYGGKFRWRQDKGDMSTKNDTALFSLYNSAWFMVCTTLMQGPEVYPRSPSARIATAFFWFTIFIITASYTANLTAHLTVNRLETSISSVYDLANQDTILYGATKNGFEQTFFASTTADPYNRMYDFMNLHDTWFTSRKEALKWVRSGNVRGKQAKYAMIGDQPYLQYLTANQEPCDTVMIKSPFLSGDYGLAFRKHNPYIPAFNLALTRLAQDGWLDQLKTKWILKGKCNNYKVNADTNAASKDTLDAYKLRGVFVVCAVGFGFGFVVLLIECALFKRKSKTSKELPSIDQLPVKVHEFSGFYKSKENGHTNYGFDNTDTTAI